MENQIQVPTESEFLQYVQSQLEKVEAQIRMSKNCLISHNWIVVINDVYTVELNKDGITDKTTKLIPSQFTKEAAEQIVRDCRFINNKNEVIKLKRVFYKDYYFKKREDLLGVIKSIS